MLLRRSIVTSNYRTINGMLSLSASRSVRSPVCVSCRSTEWTWHYKLNCIGMYFPNLSPPGRQCPYLGSSVSYGLSVPKRFSMVYRKLCHRSCSCRHSCWRGRCLGIEYEALLGHCVYQNATDPSVRGENNAIKGKWLIQNTTTYRFVAVG